MQSRLPQCPNIGLQSLSPHIQPIWCLNDLYRVFLFNQMPAFEKSLKNHSSILWSVHELPISSLLWNVTYFFSFFLTECYEPTPWQSQITAAIWQWEEVGTDLWSGKKHWCFCSRNNREENRISFLNISDFFQEVHEFLSCDLPSCCLWPKEKLENDILFLHYFNSLLYF